MFLMRADNYYILTALAGLPELGGSVPMTPVQLLEQVAELPVPRTLMEAIFLSDDLLQHQSYLAGEITELEPAVLTGDQARGESPLPGYLAIDKENQVNQRISVDRLWVAYFRHAEKIARDNGCKFLAKWVCYEVGLRNALAEARAKALNLDPNDYRLAIEVGGSDEDFTTLVNAWSSAATPLAGEQVLDKARWDWLLEHEGWFTFENDELAVYAARLMVLNRSQRFG